MTASASPASNPHDVPTYADVERAAGRLRGVAHRTPVLTARTANRLAGAEFFFKCENFQRSGAFKFRGAYNCLSRLDRAAFPGGVVAYSTGNHGQAIATVGRMLGIAATIVMPADAPAIKISKARENGANVVLYDRQTQSREQIAADPAHHRLANAQHKGHRNRRIDCISARSQHIDADQSRQRMRCGADAVAGIDGRTARQLKIAHECSPR